MRWRPSWRRTRLRRPPPPAHPGPPAIPSDDDWLAAAARLSARGRPRSRPNPSVGAVIVRGGAMVGRGWTQPGGRPHAEAMALAQAGDAASGASVYVTLEPCAHRSPRGPACAELLAAARPARVVVGCLDPDPRTAGKGLARLAAAGIETMVLNHDPSRAALAGHFAHARLGRPQVTLKLALSLDGQIALADGSSRWITGEAARAHVHSRRALADAILVGGATWRRDGPRLDVRLADLEQASPRPIVLTRGPAPDGVTVIDAPARITDLDGTRYLYVEGGAATAAAFLAEDLVDRLELYRAPILIGAGRGAIGDIGLASLDRAHGRWQLTERRQLGSDTFEAYERMRED